jgi:hypothetical protein
VDFVIAGFGLGSLLLLLGLAARDLGPRLTPRIQASSSLTSDPAFKPRDVDLWRRLVPLAGNTIMIGGAVVIVATFAGIFLQLSDHAAGRLVLFSTLGALLLIAIRLPYLGRAEPIVNRPTKPRRPAPPPRTRAQPVMAAPSTNGNANASKSARNRQNAPAIRRQQTAAVEPETAMSAVSRAFPDLPDIFGSDEPIQTGLLERLLAEDPSWRGKGERAAEEDFAESESRLTSEPSEPSSSSGSASPGRPYA